MPSSSVVLLESVRAMCVAAKDTPAGRRRAVRYLKGLFPRLGSRQFYSIVQPDGQYLAGLSMEPGDDPRALGLLVRIIPGGAYARDRVWNWADRKDDIATRFARLKKEHAPDATRARIECYRSIRELVLLLPVKAPRQAPLLFSLANPTITNNA